MSKLLLDESPLVVQRSLVRRFGPAEAIIIQQLHYWAQKSTNIHDGQRWVWKTYSEWSDETGMSGKAARGALDKLRKAKVVEAIESPLDARDRTLWWRIDYTVVDDQGSPSAREGSPAAEEGSSRARVPSGPSDPQGDVMQQESTSVEKASVEAAARLDAPDLVKDLFEYWQRTCEHPTAKATRDRTSKISARLREGYAPEQIRKGIDGARRDPFVNDAGKRFDDIELICRTGSKLEGFIERSSVAPRSSSQQPAPQRFSSEPERRPGPGAWDETKAREKRMAEIYAERAAAAAEREAGEA